MKHTIAVTFTADEWQQFQRTDEAMNHWLTEMHGRRWKQWVTRRAVYAVLRELASHGKKSPPLPMAVDLRMETREETDARMGRPRPGLWDRGGGFAE